MANNHDTVARGTIVDLIDAITRRPGMYAGTNEAFVAQLSVLLSLINLHARNELYELLPRCGNMALNLGDRLDDFYANKIGAVARSLAGLPPLPVTNT